VVATLERPKAKEFFEKEELSDEIAWAAWLSPVHRRVFAGELWQLLAADAPDEAFEAFMSEWRATAELDRSPEVLEEIDRNRARALESVDEWRARKATTA
jgi:hypothetical protein